MVLVRDVSGQWSNSPVDPSGPVAGQQRLVNVSSIPLLACVHKHRGGSAKGRGALEGE